MPPRVVLGEGLLARNALLNLLGFTIPLIVALFSVPPVIKGLGAERFGILALIWAVTAYSSLFDLGLGRATTKFVAEAIEQTDDDRIGAIVSTSVMVQACLGVLGSLLLVAVAPFLAQHLLKVPSNLTATTQLSFRIAALSVPIVLISGSLRGVLEAAQRFDLVNAVRGPISAANFLLPFAGVLAGWDLPAIVASVVMFSGLAMLAQYGMCKRLFPTLRLYRRRPFSELRRLARFGSWVSVSSVASPILVYLDRFMIGALSSVAAVSYYAAPYEIVTRLWIVPTSLVTTLFPAFSALHTRSQVGAFQTLVARSAKYLLVVLGPLVIVLIVLGRDILQLWLGSEFAIRSVRALQVLAVGVLLHSLAQVPYSLIQAVGRPDLTAKLHLAELPLHAFIVWRLVGAWGITGAAVAWSLRAGFDATLLYLLAWRACSVSPAFLATQKLPQTVALLLVSASVALGANSIPEAAWLRFPTFAAIVIAASAVTWRYLFDAGDRARIVRLIQPPRRPPLRSAHGGDERQ
jgi:O-antigen/teichoic acid export membrane protein